MIVHHFPRPCPPKGSPNLVIHARGRGIEYDEHEAPLSIKCVFQGKEVHEVRGIPYVVDEDKYLLLNHGRRYSSRIGSDQETETFSIFFEQDFTKQALRTWLESPDRLLEDPDAVGKHPVEFVESIYSRDSTLSGLLAELRDGSTAGQANGLPEKAWLDEHLFDLFCHLLSLHSDLLRRMDRLPAIKSSTRVEQYRRLRRARDFIDAYFTNEVPLTEIGRIAFLSPFHLLRLFKEAFGTTPHQYVTHKRLDHARRQLEDTDLTVSEICNNVGYESFGSFSRKFKKHFGASPQQYRAGLQK